MNKSIAMSTLIMAMSTISVMTHANATPVPMASAVDASTVLVFGEPQVANIQAMELSMQEMKETQGALAPWVIGGIAGGTFGGLGYSYGVWTGNYNWNTTNFLGNVDTGALIGSTFGAVGAAAGGGLSVGANVWRINSFSTNFGLNSIWRR